MKAVLVVLLSLVVAVPAIAGPPANGTYTSTDIGGNMLPGRYSEAWPTGSKLSIGNTLHEESWDGATLGAQWRWFCPYVAAPAVLLFSNVDGNGNGMKIWRVTYAGGFMWLNGPGTPWDGGDPNYTATVNTWVAIVTETYAGGVEVGTVRNHNSTATFNNYPNECLNLAISNLEKLDDTATGPLPANFPYFMDSGTCMMSANPNGEWGDVDSITFTITGCETVRTEAKSWGAVKAMYRN